MGALEFFDLQVADELLSGLRRCSFVQGVYSRDGARLTPLDIPDDFALHEDFVFGSKYRGKTNERLTQLLLNIGIASSGTGVSQLKLLDPMCGRGTTLLWAMRYGVRSRGVEQDPAALADLRRHLKKWTKLHRVKHRLDEGKLSVRSEPGIAKTKSGRSAFLEFEAAGASLRLQIGDAREIDSLLGGERFDLLVSDLPYGVQHFTTRKTRNPLAVVDESADAWVRSLRPGGHLVLAFNRYQPRREELAAVFERAGLLALDFHAAHRMSESIVRDILVMRRGKPANG